MHDTFGSTCHGAGRARSRNNSRNKLDYQEVLDALKTKGIAIRVASPKLVMEEAPESYKVRPCLIHACFFAAALCLCMIGSFLMVRVTITIATWHVLVKVISLVQQQIHWHCISTCVEGVLLKCRTLPRW